MGTAHENKRYSCPLAKEKDCTDLFTSNSDANIHAHSAHGNLRYLCPLAKEKDCTELLS